MDKATDKIFLIEYRENQQKILSRLLENVLEDEKNDAIFNALTRAGIRSVADMMMLTDEDINNLTYVDIDKYEMKNNREQKSSNHLITHKILCEP